MISFHDVLALKRVFLVINLFLNFLLDFGNLDHVLMKFIQLFLIFRCRHFFICVPDLYKLIKLFFYV